MESYTRVIVKPILTMGICWALMVAFNEPRIEIDSIMRKKERQNLT